EYTVPRDYVAIDVKQTQLLLTGVIQASEPVRAVAPVILSGRPGLLLVQDSGVAFYDISPGEQARLLLRVSSPDLAGFSGALAIGHEIVAWGLKGIVVLSLDQDFGEIHVEQLS